MKLAKNFAAVTLLVFAFSVTAFGGDQQTPGYVPPPPPPSRMTATSPVETPEESPVVTNAPADVEETSNILWYEALLGLLSIY